MDDTTLPDDWEPLFVNANDGSNEGLIALPLLLYCNFFADLNALFSQ